MRNFTDRKTTFVAKDGDGGIIAKITIETDSPYYDLSVSREIGDVMKNHYINITKGETKLK